MIFCTVDCTAYRLNVSRHLAVSSAVCMRFHARERSDARSEGVLKVQGQRRSECSEDCNLELCIVEGQGLSDEHER